MFLKRLSCLFYTVIESHRGDSNSELCTKSTLFAQTSALIGAPVAEKHLIALIRVQLVKWPQCGHDIQMWLSRPYQGGIRNTQGILIIRQTVPLNNNLPWNSHTVEPVTKVATHWLFMRDFVGTGSFLSIDTFCRFCKQMLSGVYQDTGRRRRQVSSTQVSTPSATWEWDQVLRWIKDVFLKTLTTAERDNELPNKTE